METCCGYGHDQGRKEIHIWFFKDNLKHTRRFSRQGAMFVNQPKLQAICFQGKRQSKRKDNAYQGSPLYHQINLCCHALPSSWLGNLNPIPCQETKQSFIAQNCFIFYDRLTHVQTLFTWNPSPLQSSKFPFE